MSSLIFLISRLRNHSSYCVAKLCFRLTISLEKFQGLNSPPHYQSILPLFLTETSLPIPQWHFQSNSCSLPPFFFAHSPKQSTALKKCGPVFCHWFWVSCVWYPNRELVFYLSGLSCTSCLCHSDFRDPSFLSFPPFISLNTKNRGTHELHPQLYFLRF